MNRLQYLHPITGRTVTRYFHTEEGLREHIREMHSPLSFCVLYDDEEYPTYGFYDVKEDVFYE